MAVIELDPEVKGRVLDFIRERGSVSPEDVANEYFPGNRRMALRCLEALYGAEDIYPSHRLGQGYRWYPTLNSAPTRVISTPVAPPVHRFQVDPEVRGWLVEFIHERERVTFADVCHEFFPGEADEAHAYLDSLKDDNIITHGGASEVYQWAYTDQKPNSSTFSHRGCGHPNTPWEKEKCRRAREESRNPVDFREKQLRSRWGQFMDDRVHELTAEQIQELTGDNITPHRFERRLRAAASNYGLKCSAKSTEKGIRFVMGDSADVESGVLDYLPREVAAQDDWGSQRTAVLAPADRPPPPRRPRGSSSHATCAHPMTKAERIKCRKARAEKAAA
ncbi:hypothetical protein OG342_14960 [Streptomyces bobili]|uniref:hypothetical protein n=1 Tax=Streptomyces bobili TaxID=67280 RepID=UPI00225AD8F0|nr:hypothetical protein [Streptomyces bobili]MCX5524155.1 hypothetical protein [Streptomyces bobili]